MRGIMGLVHQRMSMLLFFFSSRRRHTRSLCDRSSDVCSSDLMATLAKSVSAADIVLAMETDLAKVAMDPVARRDPKNLNNKMSLAQVKALTPSFDWDLYFRHVKAPSTARSEERRVGKECRSRWSQDT